MLIINAKIYTATEKNYDCGFILIKDDKIEKIGNMLDIDINDYTNIYDAKNKPVLPGFIDAHTHLGLVEDAISFEGDDVNEDTDPVTPELRVIDAINPCEVSFKEALLSGVTTAAVTPGSANVICGQVSVISTYGKRIDNMIIRQNLGIKFALGENPKSVYNSKNQKPVTRMAIVSLIRETLFKAREYDENIKKAEQNEEDMPEFELKYEALRPLFNDKAQAHFHVHRADDIFTAIRIAKEFSLNLVLVHATEGYLIADEITDYPCIIGPIMTDRSKPELQNLSLEAPKILNDNGVLFALSTDHPETPLKFLRHTLELIIKNGVCEYEAIKSITINPAKILGIDDTRGSIEEGKICDLVILDGDLLSVKTKVFDVICGGVLVNERN